MKSANKTRSRRAAPKFLLMVMLAGILLAAMAVPAMAETGGNMGVQCQAYNIPGVPIPPSPVDIWLDSVGRPNYVYSVYLFTGQYISFTLDSTPGVVIDMYIYDKDATSISHDPPMFGTSGATYPKSFILVAPATGTYYLRLFAQPIPGENKGNANVTYYQTPVFGMSPSAVHRFYKQYEGSHFFTANQSEATYVNNNLYATYRYEGQAFNTNVGLVAGSIPVYRFYNTQNGVHFYTSNWNEANHLVLDHEWLFRYEGIAFYAYPDDQGGTASPIYRFYNFLQGSHFYTNNLTEKTYLEANGAWTYSYEGIAFYLP
jgi:hypothetical protein